MSRLTTLTIGAATLLCGFAAAPEAAVAGPVGQLVCNVSGGTGLLITSSKALNCRYMPAIGAESQHYLGTIRKFGLDLGNSGPGTLTWGVVSLGGCRRARLALRELYGSFRLGERGRRSRSQCARGRQQRRLHAAAGLGRNDDGRQRRGGRERTLARIRALTPGGRMTAGPLDGARLRPN